MKEYYGFDDIIVKEESEEDTKKRAFIKYIIGIFLLIMLSSFIIPHDVISSITVSKSVEQNTVQEKNITIIFSEEVQQSMHAYYLKHQSAEFKICLKGTIIGNTYSITSFYEPVIYFKTPVSVHSQMCDTETVIDLHSHPFRNCLFSEQDIISYNAFKKQNPQALGGVMCDTNRFAFY